MANAPEKISEKTKQAFNRMIDAYSDLDLKGVTVLTGNNGSGKSVVRRHIPALYRDRLDLKNENIKGWVLSTSMDARTSSNPEWGTLAGIGQDTGWIATSQNTYGNISRLFKTVDKGGAKYLIIDEFEIGCSEETILALAHYISENLQRFIKEKKLEGTLIITHSRRACEHIKHDHFVNLEGLTEEQWTTREVVPTNLEELEANELFFYIQQQNKN
jgi:hypothetical protein